MNTPLIELHDLIEQARNDLDAATEELIGDDISIGDNQTKARDNLREASCALVKILASSNGHDPAAAAQHVHIDGTKDPEAVGAAIVDAIGVGKSEIEESLKMARLELGVQCDRMGDLIGELRHGTRVTVNLGWTFWIAAALGLGVWSAVHFGGRFW